MKNETAFFGYKNGYKELLSYDFAYRLRKIQMSV